MTAAPTRTLALARRLAARVRAARAIDAGSRGWLIGSAVCAAFLVLANLDVRAHTPAPYIAGCVLLASLVGGAFWGWRRAIPLEIGAGRADAALGLNDRLTSAVELAEGSGSNESPNPVGPFAEIVFAEAESAADGVRPGAIVAMPRSRRWPIGLALIALGTVGWMFLPVRTPPSAAMAPVASAAEIKEAKQALDETIAAIDDPALDQPAGEEPDDGADAPDLASIRDRLERGELAPDDALAEAARELEEAATAAEREAEDSAADAIADAARSASEDLDPEMSPEAREIADALAAGDLAEARERARDMLDKADAMPPEARERLSRDLEQIAESLDRAAEREERQPQPQEQSSERGGDSASDPSPDPAADPDRALTEALRDRVDDLTDADRVREELEREGLDPASANDLAERIAEQERERERAARDADDLERLSDAFRDASDELSEESTDEPSDSPAPGDPPGDADRETPTPEDTTREQGDRQGDQSEQRQGDPVDQQPAPEREPEEGREKGQEQGDESGSEKSQEQGSENGQQDTPREAQDPGEQPSEQSGEQSGDQPRDQAGEQTGDQPSEQSGDQPGEQPGEQRDDPGTTPGQPSPQGQSSKDREGKATKGDDPEGERTPASGGSDGDPSESEGGGGEGGRSPGEAQGGGNTGTPNRSDGNQGEGEGSEGRSASGDGPRPGTEDESQRGRRSLTEELDRLAKDQDRARSSRESAQRMREQARELLEKATPEEREKLRRELADRAGREGFDGPPTRSGSRPWDAGSETVDARDPNADREGEREQVLDEWFNPEGEPPGGDAIPGGSPGARTTEALREAADSAERAIEQQRVPPRYRKLIRDVFKGAADRAASGDTKQDAALGRDAARTSEGKGKGDGTSEKKDD